MGRDKLEIQVISVPQCYSVAFEVPFARRAAQHYFQAGAARNILDFQYRKRYLVTEIFTPVQQPE